MGTVRVRLRAGEELKERNNVTRILRVRTVIHASLNTPLSLMTKLSNKSKL